MRRSYPTVDWRVMAHNDAPVRAFKALFMSSWKILRRDVPRHDTRIELLALARPFEEEAFFEDTVLGGRRVLVGGFLPQNSKFYFLILIVI